MKMGEKKSSKTLQKAIVDLGSADPKKIDAGIKTISDKGHPGIIKDLVEMLLKTQDIEYVIAPDVGDPLDPFRGLMWGLVICIPASALNHPGGGAASAVQKVTWLTLIGRPSDVDRGCV